MTDERQLSASLSAPDENRSTDSPIQGTFDHLVVRIAEGLPIGSDEGTLISDTETSRHVAASDDSISTIPVALGELDYFSVQQVTDTAAGLMVGTYRSVTFDLSAVSFCDSSIYSFLDWVDRLSGDLDVTVVTSPAIERVFGLVAGRAQ